MSFPNSSRDSIGNFSSDFLGILSVNLSRLFPKFLSGISRVILFEILEYFIANLSRDSFKKSSRCTFWIFYRELSTGILEFPLYFSSWTNPLALLFPKDFSGIHPELEGFSDLIANYSRASFCD